MDKKKKKTATRTIDTAQYISTIIFTVLDIPLAITNIFGNLVFVITLVKTKSLHTPSNVLLGSLAISDLLIGLFPQPCYTAFLIARIASQKFPQTLHTVNRTMLTISTGYSCLLSCVVSMDRCIAICHPFFYHRTATCKRNAFIAILLATACIAFGMFETLLLRPFFFHIAAILAYAIILFCYWRIFRVISVQRQRVTQMGTLEGEEQIEPRSEKKKAYVIAVILGVFYLCYTPVLSLRIYFSVTMSRPSTSGSIAFMWANFLIHVKQLC